VDGNQPATGDHQFSRHSGQQLTEIGPPNAVDSTPTLRPSVSLILPPQTPEISAGQHKIIHHGR
jgi:hypothetical protein